MGVPNTHAKSKIYKKKKISAYTASINYCHTRAQLGIQLGMNSCKSFACKLGHEVVLISTPILQALAQPTTRPPQCFRDYMSAFTDLIPRKPQKYICRTNPHCPLPKVSAKHSCQK